MPHLTTFDGGLSLRIDPSLIKLNEAQELVNVDTNPVILKSGRNFTSLDIDVESFATQFDGDWIGSNTPRQYVEYEDTLYFTEKDAIPRYYKDGQFNSLGIVRPDIITFADIQVNNHDPLGNLTEGTIQYTLTFYDINTGVESSNSDYTGEFDVEENSSVNLSNLPISSDIQVTHKRIYRLGGNLTVPTLVGEIENSVVEFTDNVPDTEATLILESTSHYPPESGMQFLVESYGIFFGLVGNGIKFSEIDKPYAWSPENSFKIRETGTGLLVIPQGILVFTRNLTYLLAGTDISQFSLTLISEYHGCINGNACEVVRNLPVWFSYDGMCTLQNGYIEVISKPLLGKLTLDIKQGIVYDEQYFILRNDGTILVFDMRHGFRFYNLDYGVPVDGLAVEEGKLYYISSGVLNEAFTGELISLSYKSPILTDGDHTEIKIYNKIYIRSDGNFEVKFYVDEKLVLTKNIDGLGTFELSPPVSSKRGYSCSFEINGVGTLYSINTRPLGSQYGI